MRLVLCLLCVLQPVTGWAGELPHDLDKRLELNKDGGFTTDLDGRPRVTVVDCLATLEAAMRKMDEPVQRLRDKELGGIVLKNDVLKVWDEAKRCWKQ